MPNCGERLKINLENCRNLENYEYVDILRKNIIRYYKIFENFQNVKNNN